MRRSSFAGLTIPEQDEGVFVDGGSFLTRNPDITDLLLRIGARDHVHDGHSALQIWSEEPGPELAVTGGGTIPAATTLYAVFTLLDEQGGETTSSLVSTITTPDPIAAPEDPLAASLLTDAGALTVGTYRYVMTLLDAAGGETTPGPPVAVTREPGPANASIELTGLATLLVDDATHYRIYRSKDGEPYYDLLVEATADTFLDDGSTTLDCGQSPPSTNTTRSTNTVTATVTASNLDYPPDDPGLGGGVAAWKLYVSTNGTFTSPALFGDVRSLDEADVPIVLDPLVFAEGAPPDVATTVAGARQINPEFEIADLTWRAPVANFAALPTAGNRDGDARITLNTGDLYLWDETASEWNVQGGAALAIRAVGEASLPPEPNLAFEGSPSTSVDVTDQPGDAETRVSISVNDAYLESKKKVTLDALTPWADLPLEAGFTQPAVGGVGEPKWPAQYRVSGETISMRGWFVAASAGAALIATLPPGARPDQTIRLPVARADETVGVLRVEPNGEVHYTAIAGANHLDGVELPLGAGGTTVTATGDFIPLPEDPYRTLGSAVPLEGGGPGETGAYGHLTGAGLFPWPRSGADGHVEVDIPLLNGGGVSTLFGPVGTITWTVLDGPNAGASGALAYSVSFDTILDFTLPAEATGGRVRIDFDLAWTEVAIT